MTDRRRETVSRRIWAAVPFKGPVGSKRRLAGLLVGAERERLSLAMLRDVLDALLSVPSIEKVLLLTPSGALDAWPDDSRLSIMDEPLTVGGAGAAGDLNLALRQAQRLASDSGVDGLLIVPSDLPLVTPADLSAVLEAGDSSSVVIAPDRAGLGTNALLLVPPAALDPSFGEESYARHHRLAGAAGRRVVVVERTGLALDLDTPSDVALLLASGRDGRAVSLLRELGVAQRLKRGETAQARSTTI